MAKDREAKRAEKEARKEEIRKFRYEMADDLSIPMLYYHGMPGDIAGFPGTFTSGYLVQRMIEAQERRAANQDKYHVY